MCVSIQALEYSIVTTLRLKKTNIKGGILDRSVWIKVHTATLTMDCLLKDEKLPVFIISYDSEQNRREQNLPLHVNVV